MFLEGVFTDTEGLGDLVVVAVLEDLFGDLKFSGSEMVVGFQVAEGLLKAVGLRLLVCAADHSVELSAPDGRVETGSCTGSRKQRCV